MIKAIIIDDEPLARSVVKEYLQDFPDITIAEECPDGFEGVKAIQLHQPDLIFLDIQMPKINGFEMLELIDEPPSVIFTTAFDEFAIKAFEAHAVDYLLKPFSKERFSKALSKWKEQKGSANHKNTTDALLESSIHSPSQHERIVVKTAGRIKIIPLSEIHYLEAADDYVKIFTKDGNFLKKKTMNYFEEVLDPRQFVRTHRSYIVQVQQITRIDAYEKENQLAILTSGAKIPVSKSGYIKLKSVLGL
ncbi:MAG TPA: LytTR family transcriptional regulator DNA-binding domain-containing protein [Chitinophagaceae bacterium]|nr:LytTR family transcriptional regulator DNA-binding domain-containing protein [Chitinophagaceae bacterium]